jgi:hypothetical protein
MNDGKDDEKFQFIDSSEIIDSSKRDNASTMANKTTIKEAKTP